MFHSILLLLLLPPLTFLKSLIRLQDILFVQVHLREYPFMTWTTFDRRVLRVSWRLNDSLISHQEFAIKCEEETTRLCNELALLQTDHLIDWAALWPEIKDRSVCFLTEVSKVAYLLMNHAVRPSCRPRCSNSFLRTTGYPWEEQRNSNHSWTFGAEVDYAVTSWMKT